MTKFLLRTRIPYQCPGYKIGSGGRIHVQVFLDFQCTRSRQAFLTIRELIKLYGHEVTFHLVPYSLPEHRQSHLMNKTCVIVAPDCRRDGIKWLEFAWALFEVQQQFSNEKCQDKTEIDIANSLATFITKWAKLPDTGVQALRDRLLNDMDVNFQAKQGTLLGAQRCVVRAPSFFINGMYVHEIDDTVTLDQWREVLQSLLGEVKPMYGGTQQSLGTGDVKPMYGTTQQLGTEVKPMYGTGTTTAPVKPASVSTAGPAIAAGPRPPVK